MKVKFAKAHKDAVIPKYAHDGDACFDLHSIEDVIVLPGETVMVKTGIHVMLPENTELQVRPRSGMSLKTPYIVKNSPGTVDEGYRGPVNVIVHCLMNAEYSGKESIVLKDNGDHDMSGVIIETMNEPLIIKKGDRIAQGAIKPTIGRGVEIVEISMDELTETERGTGGFGSTGR